MKLIPGKMNVLYTICKPGYALGAERLRPKRITKALPFNPVIVLRKAA